MEPISLIIAALAAGAAAGAGDTAGQAVRDAYAALKSLLRRRVSDDAGQTVLAQHESDPEVWRKPLEQQLIASGAPDDEAVVEAARRLLAIADPHGSRQGKYTVQVTGGQGAVIGDHAQVTQTFQGSS